MNFETKKNVGNISYLNEKRFLLKSSWTKRVRKMKHFRTVTAACLVGHFSWEQDSIGCLLQLIEAEKSQLRPVYCRHRAGLPPAAGGSRDLRARTVVGRRPAHICLKISSAQPSWDTEKVSVVRARVRVRFFSFSLWLSVPFTFQVLFLHTWNTKMGKGETTDFNCVIFWNPGWP